MRRTDFPHHVAEWDAISKMGTCRSCGLVRVYPSSDLRYAYCSTPRKERQRRYRIKAGPRQKLRVSHYGITPDEYLEMLARQGGVCAICDRPPGPRRLAVDHDHPTGTVRGLLCDACNLALGGFRDDPTLLLRAAGYVARTRNQEEPE